jgi:hypothetical protein
MFTLLKRYSGSAPVLLAVLSFSLPDPSMGEATEFLYLSGHGNDDPVPWSFRCTEGRRCATWETIAVPSNWELQGFGEYNYGHDDRPSAEEGLYRVDFAIPGEWADRRIDLVFEGSMTDTEAWINGSSVGPAHQGGFYRFRYDITDLLTFAADNTLEVEVSKRSSNRSVNRAEREADYWIFGGLFRPVLLAAYPPESIRHTAIDARHDGQLSVEVATEGVLAEARLVAEVRSLEDELSGRPIEAAVEANHAVIEISGNFQEIRPWSVEQPQLYRLVLTLLRGTRVLHRVEERFGFRTVEVRPGIGLFINGRRTLLKGINRHSFWPDSGRTTSPRVSRLDARLVKRMNMNAVRSSHYPPDRHFLETCDELGLYVIDELAGWHDAYDDRIGDVLVREMVRRDVNHPSVILWANGNEGGWNPDLDSVFSEVDPQHRPVIHPDDDSGGFDTKHYPDYRSLRSALDLSTISHRLREVFGRVNLIMPTELLHGLYDGGGGAGLEDFWSLLRESPLAAGAFLWAFLDEAVVRTDKSGALDAQGNYAPDGVVGPYRQPEASFEVIRALWSPIAFSSASTFFSGEITVENRYDETELSLCTFTWELIDFLPAPEGPRAVTLASGSRTGPDLSPGQRGPLQLDLPADWRRADVLVVKAFDPHGEEVTTWSQPIQRSKGALTDFRLGGLNRHFGLSAWNVRDGTKGGPAEPSAEDPARKITVEETADSIALRSGALEVVIDRRKAELVRLSQADVAFPITNGPRLTTQDSKLQSLVHRQVADGHLIEATFAGNLQFIRWKLESSGWLNLAYQYELYGRGDYFGVTFDVPRRSQGSFRWLGRGPNPVWKNRSAGNLLGIWDSATRGPSPCGFYADVAWARFESESGSLIVEPTSPGLFVSPCSPLFPTDAGNTAVPVPSGLAFLHAIPAMGSKFHPADRLGPASQKSQAVGVYRGSLRLRLVPPVPDPGQNSRDENDVSGAK